MIVGRAIRTDGYKNKRIIPMKYFGSKSRIVKHIVPILQKEIDDNNIVNYYEPFVGGKSH